MITQVVAVDENGMIAREDFNGIIWNSRSDMRRFKEVTSHHNIIMGRTTFESIGKALPNRVNIVLTRDATWDAPEGVLVAHNKAMALSLCEPERDVFVIGGAQIYALFEDVTTEINYTVIHMDADGNVPYPVNLSRYDSYEQVYYEKTEKDDADQTVRLYRVVNKP